jgi:hypothetical protein
VGVGVGVRVGRGVAVTVGTGVGVAVGAGVPVTVGLGVGVAVGGGAPTETVTVPRFESVIPSQAA